MSIENNTHICFVSTIGSDTETPIRMWLDVISQEGYRITIIMPHLKVVEARYHAAKYIALPGAPNLWPNTRVLQLLHIFARRVLSSILIFVYLLRLHPQICICSEPDSWMVAILARYFVSMRVILYLREIFEDRIESFPKPTRSFLCSWLRGIMKWLSVRTDEIVHVSDSRQNWYCYLAKHGRVIHHYSELKGFLPYECGAVTSTEMRPVIFVHAGALRPTYRSDVLVKAFDQAVRQYPNLRLLVIGGVAGKLETEDLLFQLIADGSVQLMEQVSHDHVKSILPTCDVGIVYVSCDSITTRLAEPTKLYEYLAAGLPVLASDVPTIRSVVQKWNCGLLFEPSLPDSIAKEIIRMARDAELRQSLAQNSLNAAEVELNWEMESSKVIELMRMFSLRTSGELAQ